MKLTIASYLNSGTFADFTVSCGPYSWKTHRVIICQRSAYFARLCASPFKVGIPLGSEPSVNANRMQEATDLAITLERDDPQLMAIFLVFLYSGTYPIHREGKSAPAESVRRLLYINNQANLDLSEDKDPLTAHASLYGLADKFECPSLKQLCQNAYIRALRAKFSILDLISSIDVVYKTTPENDKGLRNWALVASNGYKSMLQPHPSFKALFTSTPDFSWDFATADNESRTYWCRSCVRFLQFADVICSCKDESIMCHLTLGWRYHSDKFLCLRCRKAAVVKLPSWVVASDNPRSRFTNPGVENALRIAVEQMQQ